MYSKSAAHYDLIYGSFKDYRAESAMLAGVIRSMNPTAHSVLDVACGTGEHARWLVEEHGFLVDGLDLDEGMLRVARAKLPTSTFTAGDMRDFALGRTYDVITCLFSSIGYMRTLANVTSALRAFRNHVAADGVVLVEPWFTPDAWRPSRVAMMTVETDSVHVCRMVHSTRQDRLTTVHFEYLIGTQDGIAHEVEEHVLGLFTVAEMTQCFEDAGVVAAYDAQGPFGRGLYVARPPQ